MIYCKRILPILNRCTIFNPTSTTWHGHPEPLNCPEGDSRKSLAVFFYTRDRPKWERRRPHTTIFRKRPDIGQANDRITVAHV
ncbi:MAG: 2OG-Fe(II) oxygenase [Planctomycetales bacterium]|nr:2OG-Fe(II) oxygenase [Planctomycetales bacterium]